MLWLKKDRLSSLVSQTPVCNILSLITLLVGLSLFILGWRNDFVFVSTFSLIPTLIGLTGFLYGPLVLRTLSFPIAYLIFLVPPPLGVLDAITIPMRYATSVITAFILESFHLPLKREGLLLFLGNHEIFIAPACSGFRSLITFICLSLLYVYFLKCSMKKKVVLILSVLPLAFIGNLARVLMLCMITYWFGDKAGQGFLHSVSGILVFLIIVSGFMLIDKFYVPEEEDE